MTGPIAEHHSVRTGALGRINMQGAHALCVSR